MGTLAAAAAGGTPRPRPDQTWRTPPPAVVSPGGMAGTFRGRYVVVYGTGPNTGVFVYSGTPATGNLIASIAPSASTDPWGNAYDQGFCSYETGVVGQLFGGKMQFYDPAFVPANKAALELAAAGAAQQEIILTTGNVSTDKAVLLSMNSATSQAVLSGTGTAIPQTSALLEVQGTAAVNVVNAIVAGAAETWHQATGLPSGFTGSVNYQLLATGRVALSVNLSIASGTSITHGETIAVLPSGYYSTLAGKFTQLTLDDNGTYATVLLQVTTAGHLAWMGAAVTVSGPSSLNGEATIAVDI